MHQPIKFILIGSVAAFIHLTILHITVRYLDFTPLWGNAIAFIIAFMVSYIGHSFWTFNHKKHEYKGSLLRFLVTQLLCSFMLNQGGYALLLKFASLNYMLASFIVLITVPVVTYTLSKYWAFK